MVDVHVNGWASLDERKAIATQVYDGANMTSEKTVQGYREEESESDGKKEKWSYGREWRRPGGRDRPREEGTVEQRRRGESRR